MAEQTLQQKIQRWALGKTSLKNIKGYSEEDLYAIAQTAYFYMMQGKLPQARTLFEGLVAIDPRQEYYYRALGLVCQRMGETERALKQFTYALRINPQSVPALINKAEIHIAQIQYAEAVIELEKASTLPSHDERLKTKALTLLQHCKRLQFQRSSLKQSPAFVALGNHSRGESP
jgi:Tfp pilus assembly protein PilF